MTRGDHPSHDHRPGALPGPASSPTGYAGPNSQVAQCQGGPGPLVAKPAELLLTGMRLVSFRNPVLIKTQRGVSFVVIKLVIKLLEVEIRIFLC